MRCQCAVTFEYEHKPSQTWRGEVTAGYGASLSAIVGRAARAAQQSLRAGRWSTAHVVVLERIKDAGDAEGDAAEPAGGDDPGDEAGPGNG